MMYGEQARFFDDEVRPLLRHKAKGMVGMASPVSNANASQFYITTGGVDSRAAGRSELAGAARALHVCTSSPGGATSLLCAGEELNSLDGKHTIFGKVRARGVSVPTAVLPAKGVRSRWRPLSACSSVCVAVQVGEGLDVLDKINEAFVDDDGRPLQNIRCAPAPRRCTSHELLPCGCSTSACTPWRLVKPRAATGAAAPVLCVLCVCVRTASATPLSWRTRLRTRRSWRRSSRPPRQSRSLSRQAPHAPRASLATCVAQGRAQRLDPMQHPCGGALTGALLT